MKQNNRNSAVNYVRNHLVTSSPCLASVFMNLCVVIQAGQCAMFVSRSAYFHIRMQMRGTAVPAVHLQESTWLQTLTPEKTAKDKCWYKQSTGVLQLVQR